ncbi:hypothetical protein D3C80_2066760 [compost metagenome]
MTVLTFLFENAKDVNLFVAVELDVNAIADCAIIKLSHPASGFQLNPAGKLCHIITPWH